MMANFSAGKHQFMGFWGICMVAAGFACVPAGAQTSIQSFEATLSEPLNFSGRVVTDKSLGSGTIVETPQTVLTAAHVIYNQGRGFAAGTTFETAFHENKARKVSPGVRQVILSGYSTALLVDGGATTAAAFARDTGVLTLASSDAGVNPSQVAREGLLLDDTHAKKTVGYPAERGFDGTLMSFSDVTTAYLELPQVPGILQNSSYKLQAGMSGGGVFVFDGGRWKIGAISVAAGVDGSLPWVRVVDSEIVALLRAAN